MIMVTTSSGRHWQSNTETVPAPLSTGADTGGRTVLGQRPFPRARTGHGPAPLPGWMLGFGHCQGLLFPPGFRVLEPSHPAPVPWNWAVCAPGATARPGCGAQPHGSTQNYGFFFFIYIFFFLLFWQKLTPPGALEKARLCTGACCPASPCAQGSEQRGCSGEGTVGRRQILVPLFSQIPLLESAIWGAGPRATLLSHPMGHRCGSRAEGQGMDTAQCLGTRSGLGWTGKKTRILQNEDKSGAFLKGLGGRVCCHPRGRCGSLVWLLRLGHRAAWPLR